MLYTINIQLTNRSCLVVGGGAVALRKAEKLLDAQAVVRVVAPQVVDGLAELAQQQRISIEQRAFEPSDVDNAVLVFAATNDQLVNQAVVREAQRRNIFVNCADSPQDSTFFVPSTVQRGAFQLAISSSGASPLFTKQIRDYFETLLPVDLETQLDQLETLRNEIKLAFAHDAVLRESEIRKQLLPRVEAIIKTMQK